MASPFDRALRGLGKLLGFTRERKQSRNIPPEQRTTMHAPSREPVEHPPLEQPEELPPQTPITIVTETPAVTREDNNVWYVSRTSKTLGRWQAGTLKNPAELQDVEALLQMVPQNVPTYQFIIHGFLESIYPSKGQYEVYLSLKISSITAQQAWQQNDISFEFVSDYVNLLESFQEGPQWVDVYELSVVDRF